MASSESDPRKETAWYAQAPDRRRTLSLSAPLASCGDRYCEHCFPALNEALRGMLDRLTDDTVRLQKILDDNDRKVTPHGHRTRGGI